MILELLSWWYSAGFAQLFRALGQKLVKTEDFFGLKNLLSTLFLPFRQISANETGISLESRLQAFGDRLISRLVGFFARIFLIFAGLVALLFEFLLSIVTLILYPLLPVLPVVCLCLFFAGVTL